MQQGMIKGQVSGILELLSDLGEVPADIIKKISEEKNPEVLKLYLRKASAAKSIKDFREFISDIKAR